MVRAQKQILPGYKLTEVGIIPEDWETKNLDSLWSFWKGSWIRKDEANSGNIPCVRYWEIYTQHNDYVKKYHSHISPNIAKTATKLKEGDLLFAGSGETKEEIGKCVAFIDKLEAYAWGDIVILSPREGEALYLGYTLNTPLLVKQKSSFWQGDAVVHISASSLKKVIVPFPTKPEQTAIAQVLSDTDNLIASLDTIIEKKRAIKQGTTNKLLAPKENWKITQLGEICEIRKWQLITNETRVNGDIPVIAWGRTPAYYHNIANRYGKTITISGSGASAWFVSFHQTPIFASDCSTIEESSSYSIEFLYFFLSHFQDYIYLKQTGWAQPHIHPNDIKPMVIALPTLKEQQDIAQILFDMDAEIQSLKSKRDKYKSIKQGMMSELLTGNIRLLWA